MEAFYQHVVGFNSERPGAVALLVELSVLAKRESKVAVDATSASDGDAPMSFALRAIAALSEHIGAFPESASDIHGSVASVCSALTEVCSALASRLTSGMLGAVVRSCNALMPLVSFVDSSLATPAPVLALVESLAGFQH